MVDFDIANRPFATHPMTGLMMPDGIFDTALGVQELHAQLRNTTAGAFAGTKVYMESVSDPNIITFPDTHDLSGLASNAIRTLSWRVDMTNAEPGEHYVSFVSTGPTGITRVIKKIFVTQTTFDPSTGTFNVDVPQGRLNVEFVSLFAPAEPCSSVRLPLDRPRAQRVARSLRDDRVSFLDLARELYSEHRADFVFCPPGYLPKRVRLTLTPTPAYAGQYGTLPFEDPFWKALLCILGVVLLAATAIVEAVWGTGSVTATTGSANDRNCCNTQAEGGGTNEVAAILAGGAAAAFTAAGLSDARDPMRRGQDHTPPASGEITVGETLNFELIPRDPVALEGRHRESCPTLGFADQAMQRVDGRVAGLLSDHRDGHALAFCTADRIPGVLVEAGDQGLVIGQVN